MWSCAFLPESIEYKFVWQVFWLIPVFWSLPIRRLANSGRYFRKPSSRKSWPGFTAAGTVADSDRIPFSLQSKCLIATPKHYKDKKIYKYLLPEIFEIWTVINIWIVYLAYFGICSLMTILQPELEFIMFPYFLIFTSTVLCSPSARSKKLKRDKIRPPASLLPVTSK